LDRTTKAEREEYKEERKAMKEDRGVIKKQKKIRDNVRRDNFRRLNKKHGFADTGAGK
jgi:hypothetical protein